MRLHFYGTTNPLPFFQEIEGVGRYGHRLQIPDGRISLENNPMSVYYPFSIDLRGAASSCSYLIFLEDHEHSARYSFGEVSFFDTGTIEVDVMPLILPDGWTGAIVFDSYDCDEDIRVPVTVTNPFEVDGLWVYRHPDSNFLGFLWNIGELDGLPAETPGDGVVLTIQRQSDHSVLAKFHIENTGALEHVQISDLSDLEFIIAPAYCFKIDARCNASYSAIIHNSSLFPPFDPTPEVIPEILLALIVAMGVIWLAVVGGIIVLITLLVMLRRRRIMREQREKKEPTEWGTGKVSGGPLLRAPV
jgi:hypothetical protein